MRAAFQRIRDGYVKFVEKQGFPVIVTLCVAVITATALWTGQREESWVAPTPPASGDVSAAQLLQQSLRDAAAVTPSPTDTPQAWRSPLEQVSILRPFSTKSMSCSGVTGVWSVHDAVDLQAAHGDKVCAMADGTVTAAGEDKLLGVWLKINHGDGIDALYAGMAMAGAYIAGDDVRAGDVIGFAGSGPMDETDLGAHLHLRVTQDGQPIDPCTLWSQE